MQEVSVSSASLPGTAADAPNNAVFDPALERALDYAVDAFLDDPKAVFRFKVLRATRRLIAKKGLDISMDDVADAAGIARRTLFRHVDSRDSLVADALSSALDWYDARLGHSTQVDLADKPLDEWISDLALSTMQIQIDAGRGLWQLAATPDQELPLELATVNKRRRTTRRTSTAATAAIIWQRAGGTGACPLLVVDATAIVMSSFTTRSMTEDFGLDVTAVAHSIGTILATVVSAQVALQAISHRATPSSRAERNPANQKPDRAKSTRSKTPKHPSAKHPLPTPRKARS